jgi:H/ACA ribonucleoprotein complex non-core subunit NAF1
MEVEFKVPSAIPQDLLLIQDLIGTPALLTETPTRISDPPNSGDDSIDSTDNEVDSEDEVEADLLPRKEENEKLSPM